MEYHRDFTYDNKTERQCFINVPQLVNSQFVETGISAEWNTTQQCKEINYRYNIYLDTTM